MSVPVRFKTQPTTCPIGDRPAVCLTQYLPHDESAHVLTLNCGDPRDVLFTIHSRVSDTPLSDVPVLDFTCCESDATVMARNVLIYTLLAESTDGNATQNSKIWNICYDLLIDGASSSLLYNQAFKLRKRTLSLDQWNGSDNEYNKYIRMCSNDTVDKLRSQFDVYEKAKHYSKSQKKRFKDKFKSRMEECRHELSSSPRQHRGIGSYWDKALAPIDQLREQYWSTGTTTRDPHLHDLAILPNPTLASHHTSTNFNLLVHSGVHPVDGFNLSPTYVHCQWKEDEQPCNEHERDIKGKDLEPAEVCIAKKQFFRWAESFRKGIKGKKLMIRIAVTDPLSACLALSHLRDDNPPDYLSPWNAKTFMLEDPEYSTRCCRAPTKFDSIDTGMLVGTMGHLNILLMTHPLLLKLNWASIRTRFSWSRGDGVFSAASRWDLMIDPTLLGIFLQMLPLGHIAGYSSESDANDICRINSEPFRGFDSLVEGLESIVWKWIPLQTEYPLSMEPVKLVLVFERLFKNLCQPESSGTVAGVDQDYYRQRIKPHNTPGTFATFLALLRRRIRLEDWDIAFERFLGRQQENPFRLTYQELVTQLDICQLKDLVPVELRTDPTPPATPTDSEPESEIISGPRLFEDWKEIPEKVCVTLTVPTEVVEELEASCKVNDHLDPILLIQVGGSELHQFSCLFPLRAHARRVNFQMIPFVELDEAPKGPLTVSVWIPTSLIDVSSPKETKIRLLANANWGKETPEEYTNKTLYQTNFADFSSVLTSSERPNMFSDLRRMISHYALTMDDNMTSRSHPSLSTSMELTPRPLPIEVFLDENMFVQKYVFFKPLLGLDQAEVCPLGTPIVKPFRALIMDRKLDSEDELLQITALPMTGCRYDKEFPGQHCFPSRFVSEKSDHTLSWTLHSINLDILPLVDVQTPRAIPYLRKIWEATYDTADHVDKEWEHRDDVSGYQDLKYTIWVMFKLFADTMLPPMAIFNLVSYTNEPRLIIFINGIRLDLGNNSMVLDCDFLPVTNPEILRTVKLALLQIHGQQVHMFSHPVGDSEWHCWTEGGYMRSATERCRTWKHKWNCDYLRTNQDTAYKLICSCAAGRHSPAFARNQRWRHLRNYVTRAAVSPLFDWPGIPVSSRILFRADSIKADRMSNIVAAPEDKAPALPVNHLCDTCGRQESTWCCRRCLNAWYCNSQCEHEGWKSFHVHECDSMVMSMNRGTAGEGSKKKKKKKKKKKSSGAAVAGTGGEEVNGGEEEDGAEVEDLTSELYQINGALANGSGNKIKNYEAVKAGV